MSSILGSQSAIASSSVTSPGTALSDTSAFPTASVCIDEKSPIFVPELIVPAGCFGFVHVNVYHFGLTEWWSVFVGRFTGICVFQRICGVFHGLY
jgi:hypothetical protein